MTPRNSSYLRPVFTEKIIQELIKRGNSLNLIGAQGTGRTRLLEDIKRSNPKDTLIIKANLKSYKESYSGFISTVWEQSGGQGGKPETMGDIIAHLEERQGKVIVLLDNFDALLDNPHIDEKFDSTFYDTLNSMKNRRNIGLLCVTENPHDHSVIHFGGKPHGNSWLDLYKIRLPKLTYHEIEKEFSRTIALSLSPDERTLIIDTIHHSSEPSHFITFFTEKISNNEDLTLSLKKRLKKWEKEYEKQKSSLTAPNRLHKFVISMKNLARVTGVDKLGTPFLSIAKLIQYLVNKLIKPS